MERPLLGTTECSICARPAAGTEVHQGAHIGGDGCRATGRRVAAGVGARGQRDRSAGRSIPPYAGEVSIVGDPGSGELVVADDGSIPAEQWRRLGLRPGTHLRVVEAAPARPSGPLAGSLPNFPDLSWEDFEIVDREFGAGHGVPRHAASDP